MGSSGCAVLIYLIIRAVSVIVFLVTRQRRFIGRNCVFAMFLGILVTHAITAFVLFLLSVLFLFRHLLTQAWRFSRHHHLRS